MCLQQDLFDMTMVTIMFDTKSSESETFIDGSIEGITNLMMEFHHFQNEYDGIPVFLSIGGEFMMSAHHMMGFHHMMCVLPIKW